MTQQVVFQREVLINAPLSHVWQLVATEEGLRQWWGNTIYMEAKEGGRCEEWRAADHHAGNQRMAHWQGVVTMYAPPHQLMMTLAAQDGADDQPELTTIAIALEAQGEKTRVQVTQRAFGRAAVSSTTDQAITPQPARPRTVPLAQLIRPAPGVPPQPVPAVTPRSIVPASIDPAAIRLSRGQDAALTSAWQQRLGALIAVAAASH